MHADKHEFPIELFLAILATFVVVFGAELLLDLLIDARHAKVPFMEVVSASSGTPSLAAQAGGSIARASYCMLFMCVSLFTLSIPIAANLYTAKLVELYLLDRVNQAVFAFGVFLSANSHFLTTVTWDLWRGPGGVPVKPEIPLVSGLLYLLIVVLIGAAWAILIPYAFYAWRFLSPEVLIDRLIRMGRRDLASATRDPKRLVKAAEHLAQAIFDLANLTLRGVDRSDRELTLMGTRGLTRLVRNYMSYKKGLSDSWFRPDARWFPGLSNEALTLIERERNWVAYLVLHQVQLIFQASLLKIPDTAGPVASVACKTSIEGAQCGDVPVVALSIRFMGTYLRETINRGDAAVVQAVVRVHIDLLHSLGDAMGPEAERLIAEDARHLGHYHEVARKARFHSGADSIALGLARLIEREISKHPTAIATLAGVFLDLTEPPSGVDLSAFVKAHAIVLTSLAETTLDVETEAAKTRLAGFLPRDREEARSALEAADSRQRAGREVYGFEPNVEYVAEPRRSLCIAALTVR